MNKKIRLENLRHLAYEYCSQASLAQALGMDHKEIIQYFVNKNTDISDKFARRIEQTLHKPNGWMDRKNYDLALTLGCLPQLFC